MSDDSHSWPAGSGDEDDTRSNVNQGSQGQNGHPGNGAFTHDSSPEPGSDNSGDLIAGQQLDGMGSQPLPND